MKEMTLEHIAQACHGIYVGDPGKMQTEIEGAGGLPLHPHQRRARRRA